MLRLTDPRSILSCPLNAFSRVVKVLWKRGRTSVLWKSCFHLLAQQLIAAGANPVQASSNGDAARAGATECTGGGLTGRRWRRTGRNFRVRLATLAPRTFPHGSSRTLLVRTAWLSRKMPFWKDKTRGRCFPSH